MKLYRSIGTKELDILMAGKEVNGQYNSFNFREHIIKTNDAERLENIVCFFTDRIRWKDAEHYVFLEAEISDKELTFGIGIYHAAKSLAKTNTWSGRWGNTRYEFQEAYINKYDESNITAIYIGDKYADWYVEKYIVPWTKKNGIILLEKF